MNRRAPLRHTATAAALTELMLETFRLNGRLLAAGDKLVAQYDAYEPLPGAHVNGKQTLAENIADVAGLAAAYDALGRPEIALLHDDEGQRARLERHLARRAQQGRARRGARERTGADAESARGREGRGCGDDRGR